MTNARLLSSPRLAAAAVAGLILMNAALSIGLLVTALRGRATLVVPGIPKEHVSIPSVVPDAAIRHFALLYLLYFDDYTPATVVERTRYLLPLVSADRVETARRALEERATYVARARESSQLSPPLPEAVEVERTSDNRYRVKLTALRRTFIADAPKETLEVGYRLEIVPVVPSGTNPFGLVVAEQAVHARPVPGLERKEEKDGR